MLRFSIIIVGLFSICSFQAEAQHQTELLPYSSFYVDSLNLLSTGDSTSVHFTKRNRFSRDFPTWIRIDFPARVPDGEYCIDFFLSDLKELYDPAQLNTVITRNGTVVPPSLRSVSIHPRYLCFTLSRDHRTIFVKVSPMEGVEKILPPIILEDKVFVDERMRSTLHLSFVVVGVMFTIILCSFTLYFFLLDLSFILFGLYLIFFNIMVNKNFLSYLFGDDLPLLMLDPHVNQVYFILGPLFFLLFSVTFFEVRERSATWTRIFYMAIGLCLVCFATVYSPLSSTIVLLYNFLSIVLVTCYAIIAFVKQKFIPAAYFLVGIGAPFIVAALIVLNTLQVIAVDRLQLLADISILVFGFLLSIGVVKRYRQVNIDKLHREHEAELLKVKSKELESHNAIIEGQKMKIELQAQGLLELNETKDKLLSVLSHDLRGPIGNLRAILSMVSNQQLTSEEFQTLSGKLKTDVEGTYSMLEEVLEWVKSQREGIIPRKTGFDVADLIREVVLQSLQQSSAKKISTSVTGLGSAVVYADRDHVNIVVRNLLGNAVKFSPEGSSIAIDVSEFNEQYMISIIDHGQGIRPEDVNKILSGAKIAGTRGTRGEKSTGLGLLLCQEFIQYNNGKFLIESEVGKGTKISFTLDKLGE